MFTQLKPPASQAAFTLLELIVVIAILAILAAIVFAKPSASTAYKQSSTLEQLISSGRLTQQLSMNDSDRTFSLQITANQINILADGSSFSAATTNYPITIPDGITLSPNVVINFDQLGSTTATTITISGEQNLQVCFEASGLIRAC